ncbi:MAG: iron-containing alcohol dehydrogenase [Paracoccaceae bacterium]|uniref:iron-containing alcohol dehydrogenase n=1 Tax=Roseibium sp. TaxID=1936156 RepID=UPI00329946BD
MDVAEMDSRDWTVLIDDIVAGDFYDVEAGKKVSVPYDSIVFRESLDGMEEALVADLNLGDKLAVVADENTYDALGGRVVRALKAFGVNDAIVLKNPHADMRNAAELADRLKEFDSVIAVGSGTINDLCKYITAQDGRRYAVFATAASMNGYTSTTASMTLDTGLKVSLPARAPSGFFVDMAVSAVAPSHLAASGFADCVARSVAQIDWWMSHRLLGTMYRSVPFEIQIEDEIALNKCAHLLPKGDLDATARLYRVLTLCGLGIGFIGVSNPGSMGEHQISHYIDCFAGPLHPGTLHGQQVGVASLTMARIQQGLLAQSDPPVMRPTPIDANGMKQRMGGAAAECLEQLQRKAFDTVTVEKVNEKLAQIWPELKHEAQAFMIPVAEMEKLLSDAGAPTTAVDLGLDLEFYRQAVRHGHEMRDRFSFVDIAANAGVLEPTVSKQT